MNLQVFVSFDREDESQIDALARALRRHSITVIRNYLVADDASATPEVLGEALSTFATCLVVFGRGGFTQRQRTDCTLASDKKLRILVLSLPQVGRPSEVPEALESATWIQLDSLDDDGSAFETLIKALREPKYSEGDDGVLRGIPEEPRMAPEKQRSEVLLGAAAPRYVTPDSEFVARFTAYTEAHRSQVEKVLQMEAPRSTAMLDLARCQWAIGTKVTISLAARGLEINNSPQQFEWDGKWVMLRFDVEVPADRRFGTTILKFNLTIEGITIATLRPEIEVVAEATAAVEIASAQQQSPQTAFASYASQDRENVLNRVRSMQICTGMDVFVDCLSLRPAERWKRVLAKQLIDRDVFFLFWSRSAGESPWVDWEWRTVLEKKGIDFIQPHPLEPAEVAPAPGELSELQFGNAYERYIMDLRE